MEKIERIKLIMGYDMTKTLTENKKSCAISDENS